MATPAEYDAAAAKIAVVRRLMTESVERQVRSAIILALSKDPLNERWHDTITRLTSLAIGAPAASMVRLPELDLIGSPFHSVRDFLGGFPLNEDVQVLLWIARQTVKTKDASEARVVLGTMMRAGSLCNAATHQARATLLQRVASLVLREDPAMTMKPSIAGASAFNTHTVRLLRECQGLIDELKDKALASTFLEPSKAYFRAVGDATMEGDVDVHGANTFIAALEATLGVRGSRPAFLDDEDGWKGTADVMSAGIVARAAPQRHGRNLVSPQRPAPRSLVDVLPLLWRLDSLGSAWESVMATAPAADAAAHASSASSSALSSNGRGAVSLGRLGSDGIQLDARSPMRVQSGFIWTQQNLRPREWVRLATDPSPSNASHRARLAVYLHQYASYFSAAAILPQLVNRITVGGSEGDADALLVAANTVYADLKARFPQVVETIGSQQSSSAGAGATSFTDAAVASFVSAYPSLQPLLGCLREDADTRSSSSAGVGGPLVTMRAQAARLLESGSDVRYWLWVVNDKDGSMELDLTSAHLFFAAIGAVKPPCCEEAASAGQAPQRDGIASSGTAVDPDDDGSSGPDGEDESDGMAVEVEGHHWPCLGCTYLNSSSAVLCDMCESLRPDQPASDYASLGSSGSGVGADLESLPIMSSGVVRAVTAAGDIRGGGTGREFVSNLLLPAFPSQWAKWMHPGHVARSWVQYDLHAPIGIAGYGLLSANDCPGRDPAAWRLLGLPVGGAKGKWVTLHDASRVGAQVFSGRFHWIWHDLRGNNSPAAHTRFSALRLEITAVRSEGDGVQLSRWHVKIRQ